jgi:ubiquitin carboxyl-terminal hydrolase 34
LIVLLKPLDSTGKLTEVVQESDILNEIFTGHLFYQNWYESSVSENKSKTKESRAAAY